MSTISGKFFYRTVKSTVANPGRLLHRTADDTAAAAATVADPGYS